MIDKKYSKAKGSCKVTFKLSAEQVGQDRDVRVLADFNDWNWAEGVQLKRKNGHYVGAVELPAAPGHYQYRYLVDGHQWMNDGAADRYEGNIYGTTNCVFALESITTPAKKTVVRKAAPKKVNAKPVAKRATAKKVSVKKADDLKKIEGIGPKIAGLLNDAGITTFAQLGKASKKKLTGVLEAAGPRFRLAKTDTWQQQAKLAAAGKDAELTKLQAELKGGVKK